MMYNERKMKNAGKGGSGKGMPQEMKKALLKDVMGKRLSNPAKPVLGTPQSGGASGAPAPMPTMGPKAITQMPSFKGKTEMPAKAKEGGMGPMKKDYIKKMLKKKARMGGKMKTSTSMGAE